MGWDLLEVVGCYDLSGIVELDCDVVIYGVSVCLLSIDQSDCKAGLYGVPAPHLAKHGRPGIVAPSMVAFVHHLDCLAGGSDISGATLLSDKFFLYSDGA